MFYAVNQFTINAKNRCALVGINIVTWCTARSGDCVKYVIAQEAKVMYN